MILPVHLQTNNTNKNLHIENMSETTHQNIVFDLFSCHFSVLPVLSIMGISLIIIFQRKVYC